jgi:hypothetical protein
MPDDKDSKNDSGFWTTTTKIATAILAVTAVAGPAFKFAQSRYAEHHPSIIGTWSGWRVRQIKPSRTTLVILQYSPDTLPAKSQLVIENH